MNSRSSIASVPDASPFTAVLDSLHADNLTIAQQTHLLTSLRSQPLQSAQVSAVEELLTTMRLSSASHLAIGLHLLDYYHQQHDQANVARLRTWLGQQEVSDKGELMAYLRFTEALDHMVSFLPGVRPLLEADREKLRQVAISGTTSARLACQLLRAYEPACACFLLLDDQAPSADKLLKSVTKVATVEMAWPKLAAYPNPASTVLHVPYSLAKGVKTAELQAYDIQGRLVFRQVIAGIQGELEVATATWAMGLYQLRLVAGKQVLGQQRIAITAK